MRKVLSLLLVSMLISFGATAWSAEKTIKLGVIAELTGDMPAVGASCRNAAELAVKEVNAAGGLQVGKEKMKVELVVEDNAGKADQSAAAAQKLITQDEVVAIVGPNASRYAIPASEIAESEKTVLITPWSTNPKTTMDEKTGKPKDYVFRACFIDPFQGGVLAKFAYQTLKAKKAAVLYDVASDYNKGIAEVFKTNYEKLGGKIVAFETYTTNDKDFSAQLTKIKDAKPDVIFLPNYYNEVPLQVQQAKRLGITVPFIGSDSWGSPELLTLGGADLNGYYFSTHYAADNAAPVAKKFIADYEKAYGAKPDDVAALTYDAFGLLFGAIKSAGKVDREAVRVSLSTLPDYKGVTGDMKFKADSRDPIKSAVILEIKDGKFTYFTNAKP
ncbi:MAG TPA: ABC transporter substrate-binding protein [Candidatus Competibacteraceae bacterium]|nr:MAG: ABC transporter substrate-binding protein [Candidatus Competibacteraceae bacterium]HOB62701.1 ABC transporter substrate-binding protein [Candidatus Competibacteraceae bacterium]HQA26314.1 ABC transporter substrate-binding protein [Candidatus Competibacteraceae bacterium]HQD55218.1 ABC transporter substrate-binding protein [Candidatus Competibacteraceae bacterium]